MNGDRISKQRYGLPMRSTIAGAVARLSQTTHHLRSSSSKSIHPQTYRTMSSFPETIKAITFAKNGDYDVIEQTTQPFPKPAGDEFIIKVEYGGVNFIDTYIRKGLYPTKSFPARVGNEAAGIVAALPTDEKILNDEAFKKRNYSVGGKVALYATQLFGEYVAVSWRNVFPLPDHLDTKYAAAATVSGLTTISFMTEAYNVKKGDIILVHTVAGSLGLICAQYAKHLGATVIGTTSTPEKAEIAKRHGADHVILYKNEDTVQRVLEITNGEGVHAIFDGVGKDTFDSNFKMIRRKGTIVSVGNASGAVPPFSPLKLVEKNVKLLRPTVGNYLVEPDEITFYTERLFTLLSEGKLKVLLNKEYPFSAEGVQQGQRDLVEGSTVGKNLIKFA